MRSAGGPPTGALDQKPQGFYRRLKRFLRDHKTLRRIVGPIYCALKRTKRFNSASYWERRYQLGGNSGAGSYGHLAEYKANFCNDFVRSHDVSSVIEFGSGDGAQLGLFRFERYIGLDVSKTSVKMCIERYGHDKTKSFFLYDAECFRDNHKLFEAELALSLDVLYHLVEDDIFERYMRSLFAAATRFVIIYASNTNANTPTQAQHVRHRKFTEWVEQQEPEWELVGHEANKYGLETFANFFIYSRKQAKNARSPKLDS